MVARIEARLRLLRRKFSRSRWLTRLLRLSVAESLPAAPGLLMIQIDGLSQQQFRHALEHGELPFLRRLLRKEQYGEHTLYSGLPASTPAFQAELFYGVRTAVPAFSFRERESGKVVRLYQPEVAARIEQRLAASGQMPLCRGGSAYLNLFTGGAKIEEAHFCASSLTGNHILRSAKPLAVVVLVLTHLASVLRIGTLLVVELLLAVTDFFRGLSDGHSFAKELKFIPTRVAISILLRELCVIGGKIDLNRGLPIVHINFLGYDEQSHRRGPQAKFAHWTLKGIDYAIKRLWREANRSQRRHYDLWIYSDHGQSATSAYHKLRGYTLPEAVARTLNDQCADGGKVVREPSPVERLSLGYVTECLCSAIGYRGAGNGGVPQLKHDRPEVVGLGPVALLYFATKYPPDKLADIAAELVNKHGVPAVILARGDEQLRAWTRRGELLLPQQIADLCGDQHPFLSVLGADLAALCRHPDAGDLIALGWCAGEPPVTFAVENGSHAGLSPEETSAFMLLPRDAPLPQTSCDFYRAAELREAALRFLKRKATPATVRNAKPTSLRVMTYNVHSCIGLDGRLDVQRVARVIAREAPDVVALQELDLGRLRTAGQDQARQIAQYLEMDYHFHPVLHVEEEQYGDAILTHLPLQLIKAEALPGAARRPEAEPRGALWVAVEVAGREVQIINTHLGLFSDERLLQIETLLGADWLGSRLCREPVILCGDFNAGPGSQAYQKMCGRLADAQQQLPGHKPGKTFYSRVPVIRIDHIFVDAGIRVVKAAVPSSRLVRIASDHLPLVVEVMV